MTVAQAVPYQLSRLLLWLVFRGAYGLSVRGQRHVPRRGPCILAGNHVSYLDPPLLGVACPRPIDFMARSSLFAKPLLGAYLRSIGAVPLRRGEADLGALRAAIVKLRRGGVVAIFPEGTRQLSGRLGQAKRGVGLLAMAAKAPIVPAVVQGTFEAMGPTGPLRLRRSKISVAFGPPIPYTLGSTVSGASRNAHQQLAEAVTTAWRQLAAQLSSPTTLKTR
ncbi:MAG: 1-acyl-sn-glycerol-3-phosphate acyltransferase [Candidatus Omnitrophica bacterium]|nr:1-acyl-sn-glycerol-3-phosphate acyltransferase [Candidatus Omnitrophota bacterium]